MADIETKFDREGSESMDNLAKGLFAPIYPVIAEEITESLGITEGTCIDIGSGPASLSIALAKITNLNMILLDSSEDMQRLAEENLHDEGKEFSERFRHLHADVHRIPLDDETADLIISRGSMFFWEDLDLAFSEIYRVLAPGGSTYIGGGFGNAELRDSICEEMITRDPDWKNFRDRNLGKETRENINKVLGSLNPDSFRLISDESGFWIIISKKGSA